jgi:hypothetical protein
MVSRSVRLVLALLLIAVALAACQPPTAPPPEPAASPTEPAAATPVPAASPIEPATATPKQQAVAEPDTTPVVIVSDRPFTLAELQALDQVTTDDGDQGVGLLALLKAAGVDSEVVILAASDGYSANVPVADVDEAAALVYTKDGKLNAVIPTLPRSESVKDVIEIRGGGAENGSRGRTVSRAAGDRRCGRPLHYPDRATPAYHGRGAWPAHVAAYPLYVR